MKKLSRGLVVVFLAAALPAFAHPHVFVNNKMTVVFDGGMLQGISFTWTFDEMFSNMILADYDPKHTGQFNAAQVKAVKAGAFDNLENYHYFIALAVGKRQLSHFAIQRFTPSVADKTKLVYTFFIPLMVPLKPAEQSVHATVYDDSYYVAFDLLPGQYMPDQLVIRFKESS
jgi:ABC-type uncharacterized transport system substrate-binding protein